MPIVPDRERRTLYYERSMCDPKEWLNFVQLDPFPKAWKGLGLDDDALRALEIAIMSWPDKPAVVGGTGGLRKLRFAPESWNKGKRASARVYYAYFPEHGLIALIYAHNKNGQENLTERQKREIKALIEEIQTYLDGGKERRQ